MTIRHLQIFVEVAESGKMSVAAEHLFISQPTVSQAIRELENHYQIRLFERFSKRLFITEAGEQLLGYARKLLSQYEVLETNMAIFHETEQLRVGGTITVGACLLSSVLNDLKLQYPNLRTYACVANTSLIERKLLNSELDVALVEGVISSSDLIAIPVVDDYLVLAVACSHPLAERREVGIRELADYDFVVREKGSGTRSLFESYMEKQGIPFHITWEATCLDAIKAAILHNGCISAISVRLIEQELRQGQMRAIRSGESAWNRHFYLVYHKDKRFTEPMHALQEIVGAYKCPEFLEGLQTGVLTVA